MPIYNNLYKEQSAIMEGVGGLGACSPKIFCFSKCPENQFDAISVYICSLHSAKVFPQNQHTISVS